MIWGANPRRKLWPFHFANWLPTANSSRPAGAISSNFGWAPNVTTRIRPPFTLAQCSMPAQPRIGSGSFGGGAGTGAGFATTVGTVFVRDFTTGTTGLSTGAGDADGTAVTLVPIFEDEHPTKKIVKTIASAPPTRTRNKRSMGAHCAGNGLKVKSKVVMLLSR